MNTDFQCVCRDPRTGDYLNLCGTELCAQARARGYNN